jgi:hypothetical protein
MGLRSRTEGHFGIGRDDAFQQLGPPGYFYDLTLVVHSGPARGVVSSIESVHRFVSLG